MALLNILRFPDPRLATVAKPVQAVDERIRTLVRDMAETMYAAPGIGLAATQVNVHEQVVVLDLSETKDDLQVFINPQIVAQSVETEVCEEGCLSVPGIYDQVERSMRVTVEALDLDGKKFKVEADGMLAVCLQHEIDHLQGTVFVEHLSRLKQTRIKTRLQKQAKAL
ncbi:MAG: peptide deformylase [Burkholderiaceae bacterium]|nr:MAG: peptide deformylase [Burkholderiaceae bacterium]